MSTKAQPTVAHGTGSDSGISSRAAWLLKSGRALSGSKVARRIRHMRAPQWLACTISVTALACGDGKTAPVTPPDLPWTRVGDSPGAALFSVHGTAKDDVWMVGSDDGQGPLALHWDGQAWERRATGLRGDLWWVHALPQGPVFLAGTDGAILRYQDGAFARMKTPALGKDIVFGVWAATPTDAYAVGSAAGRNGFVWHYDGDTWQELTLPTDLPLNEHHDTPAFFKVWGVSANEVWVVGASGAVMRGNVNDGFRMVPWLDVDGKPGTATLFTVHVGDERVLIVGGDNQGVLLQWDGEKLVNRSPDASPLLQGVCVGHDGEAWASGLSGTMYRSSGDGFIATDTGIDFSATQSLHAAWVDPDNGVWSVGGKVLTAPLEAGVAVHRGAPVPEFRIEPPTPPAATCPDAAIDPAPDGSIARRWNEQILNAIRRDTPRPTVHARNLFHTSLAMWDAWAAYDDVASGYVVQERHTASDIASARQEAISYATYRVLAARYAPPAVGAATSQACFDAFMARLGYPVADSEAGGDGPRAVGNRIGAAILARFASDGANEAKNYAPSEPYKSEIPGLRVDEPGTRTTDPTKWQQLVLAQAITQNGIPLAAGAQDYVGPHWGAVEPFALVRPSAGIPYLDIGHAPTVLDEHLVEEAVEIVRKSSQLDIDDGVMVDISPASFGHSPLGTNDGHGYAENPVTGHAYVPQPVKRGDFTRALAEFWADGPKSETPPGHWNVLANSVAQHPLSTHKLFGEGPALDALSWDVHTYLALNGALHDAAIAAWELKRVYTTARPITLIRYMGGKGQRSDPAQPSYDPAGLPLVDGLIEVITDESAAPGARHAHLARYVGEMAVRAWRGEPGDRVHDNGGVGWIRAIEWTPYQRRTFVTPAFPGYVSGHSSFSRAAATVLAGLTGSEFFPGGLATFSCDPGYLVFEHGPSARVELQWATYFDAADQAGLSRLWGGIHIPQDDFDGRRIGSRVGLRALDRAKGLYSTPPP
jgi:hypothetical protein